MGLASIRVEMQNSKLRLHLEFVARRVAMADTMNGSYVARAHCQG